MPWRSILCRLPMGRWLPVLATGCIAPRRTGPRVIRNVLTLQEETAKTADAGYRWKGIVGVKSEVHRVVVHFIEQRIGLIPRAVLVNGFDTAAS